jgi:hypothetical protein
MFIINDPGPWQYYHHRMDNVGLNVEQLRQKYLTEQLMFEEQQYISYMNWLAVQGKGQVGPESTPEVELLTENGQVLQTENGEDLILT